MDHMEQMEHTLSLFIPGPPCYDEMGQTAHHGGYRKVVMLQYTMTFDGGISFRMKLFPVKPILRAILSARCQVANGKP